MYYRLACIPTGSYSVVNDHATIATAYHLKRLKIATGYYSNGLLSQSETRQVKIKHRNQEKTTNLIPDIPRPIAISLSHHNIQRSTPTLLPQEKKPTVRVMSRKVKFCRWTGRRIKLRYNL
jgi:hypothetical protein